MRLYGSIGLYTALRSSVRLSQLCAALFGVCGTTEKFQHPVFCSGQLVRVMNIAFKWAGGPSIEQRPPRKARRVVQRLSAGAELLTLALPAVCVTTER